MGAKPTERVLWFPAMPGQGARVASEIALPHRLIPVRDEDLLARAQTGDSEAVALLFDRFSRLVLAIGARVLRDRGEAEDRAAFTDILHFPARVVITTADPLTSARTACSVLEELSGVSERPMIIP